MVVGAGYLFIRLEINDAYKRARICHIESNTCTLGRLLAAGNDVAIALRGTNYNWRGSFFRLPDGVALLGSLVTGAGCGKIVGA